MTLQKEAIESAAGVPVGVALLLTALFVGLTLLLAFWKRRRARRLRRKAKRHGHFRWEFVWAGIAFAGFAAYALFLGNRY